MDKESPQVIPPTGNVSFKQGVWKLNTAPKLKHFLWRMITNVLATGTALRHQQILTDAACSQEEENIHHLVFLCPYAQYNMKLKAIMECNHNKRIPPLQRRMQLFGCKLMICFRKVNRDISLQEGQNKYRTGDNHKKNWVISIKQVGKKLVWIIRDEYRFYYLGDAHSEGNRVKKENVKLSS
ncbi:hypothetical protein V5N11_026817 [Cardamine amara subsp. amara]|uniref:Reverse transcriptase zinc-binding domain-containing protein n=1 Tax=Cardamine amara subsp. amara TaxID=228776 RepID=A0ABD0Z147_CARAN